MQGIKQVNYQQKHPDSNLLNKLRHHNAKENTGVGFQNRPECQEYNHWYQPIIIRFPNNSVFLEKSNDRVPKQKEKPDEDHRTDGGHEHQVEEKTVVVVLRVTEIREKAHGGSRSTQLGKACHHSRDFVNHFRQPNDFRFNKFRQDKKSGQEAEEGTHVIEQRGFDALTNDDSHISVK